MPAVISGVVFNDLNHNGVFDGGEPGISGVYVYLSSSSGLVETQTDGDGNYSFSVAAAGSYTIYETVSANVSNPPTVFTQPAGFTVSNGARKVNVSVTAANITSNATLGGYNFAHDTNVDALSCSANMIQFVGVPTEWVSINLVTGQPTIQGNLNPADYVNAIGFNIVDQYLYGYDLTTDMMVRIDAAGNLMTLGLPTGLPVTANQYNTGCFDDAGYFYLYYGGAARFYVIDLRPDSATFMRLVDPTNGFAEQTANYGVALVNGTPNMADWVWLPSDVNTGANTNGFLFGIQTGGVMGRVNLDNARVINMTTSGPTYNNSYGAISVDGEDNIYAIANQNGNVYRYTVNGTTATGVYFSNTYFDNHNDGAMCRTAILQIDFGDAPDTGIGNGPGNYNTLLANNGPRHQVTTGLTLGTQITAEEDAYQNADATGDDLIQGIQDDAITTPLPTLSTSATTYQLAVVVTNETTKSANLYGWVDFNQNGLFEPAESVAITVPASSGTATYNLNFTIPASTTLMTGITFARLRLTTDDLAQTIDTIGQDSASVGPAGDGEVEDYLLTIGDVADLQLTKTADKAQVAAGDLLTYTLNITNLGPDASQAPLLIDTLPAALKNPVYSTDGGITWQTGLGALTLPTLAAGTSYTVLIRGVVNVYAEGEIVNTSTVSSMTFDPNLANNSDGVTTPLSASADLSIVKLATPDSVLTGDLLTYTLSVANAGPSIAKQAVVTDALSAALLNAQFSLDQGMTWQPWLTTLNLGDLLPGENLSILIQGEVASDVSAAIVNTATIASQTPDPFLANNSSTIETPVVTSADLAITKVSDVNPVLSGSVLTYDLEISNNGPSDAQNVTVTDPLPSALTGASYSIDGGVSWQPYSGSYSLDVLANGTSLNLLIRGTVDVGAVGIITNTATVSSETPDANLTNNTATDLTPINQAADLAIVKTAMSTASAYGQVVTFDLAVENLGPDVAKNVVVTDAMPVELGSVMYTLDGSTWVPWTGRLNLGDLAAASRLIIQIEGTVETTEVELISNTALITSDTPDPDPSNNTSTINFPLNDPADLGVTKTATPTPATLGGELTYEVTVTNNGPEVAVNAVLTEQFPAGLLNLELSLDGSTWVAAQNPLSLGNLAVGAYQTVLYRGMVDAGDLLTTGSLSNTAVVSSDTPDAQLGNNTATLAIPLVANADLAVEKNLLSTTLLAGQAVQYGVVVKNNGPSNAVNAILVDPIASGILSPQFSLDQGVEWSAWTGSLALGTLLAGDEQLVLIQGTLSPAATGDLSNTARVYSSTPDGDLSNNVSTVTGSVVQNAVLSVSKSASPNPVMVGNELLYTIAILNEGPSYARNVVVTDTIPPELSQVQYSTDGINWQPWTGAYTYATIPVGGARTLLIKGVLTGFVEMEITNTAHAKGDDTADSYDSAEVTAQALADVGVIKWANVNHVTAGDTLQFSLTVNNYGPSVAEGVVLTDLVPTTLENPQYSLDQQTWHAWLGSYDIGEMAIDAVVVVYLQGMVTTAAIDEIVNNVQVSATTPDPNLTNNADSFEVFVQESADLSISKSANLATAQPGDKIVYTMTVENAGPSDATDVNLVDEVPSDLENVEYSLDGTTWLPWVSPLNLGTMAASTSQIIYLQGEIGVDASDYLGNLALVSSSMVDPTPANNVAVSMVAIPRICPEPPAPTDSADVSVVKVACLNVVPCDEVTYVIMVANSGPGVAEGVVLEDSLPRALYDAEYLVDGGKSWKKWTGRLELGEIAAGAYRVIRLNALIDPYTKGMIVNRARVSADTEDPNLANNLAVEKVTVC